MPTSDEITFTVPVSPSTNATSDPQDILYPQTRNLEYEISLWNTLSNPNKVLCLTKLPQNAVQNRTTNIRKLHELRNAGASGFYEWELVGYVFFAADEGLFQIAPSTDLRCVRRVNRCFTAGVELLRQQRQLPDHDWFVSGFHWTIRWLEQYALGQQIFRNVPLFATTFLRRVRKISL